MSYLNLWMVLVVAYVIILLSTLRQIILQVRSPSKTLSWLLVVLFLPLLGIILYRFMGRSMKKDRHFQLKRPFYGESQVVNLDRIPSRKSNLSRLLQKNNSASISYRNRVTVLKDGDETFGELFAALRNARKSIHLDFYIVESGKILDELVSILKERIRHGVTVRFLYDGFGSNELDQKYIYLFSKAGIEHHEFMRFNILEYFDYVNYRNHRKIAIVDSKIAFTGGMNITDKYTERKDAIGLWHDTFIKIEGAAALDFERIFQCDWFYANGKDYHIGHVDREKEAGDTVVQVISGGPNSEYKGIMHEYFTVITDAEDYVYIVTPYFIPGEAIVTALRTSALSGVDVRLMLPMVSDSKWLKWCMFSFLEELLAAGIRIYLYHDGFLHSKVMISDDIISSIGTANVDVRSFDTNFEVNAVVYDRVTAHTLKAHFFEDVKCCQELDLGSFGHRSDRNKFMEGVARLTSPML